MKKIVLPAVIVLGLVLSACSSFRNGGGLMGESSTPPGNHCFTVYYPNEKQETKCFTVP